MDRVEGDPMPSEAEFVATLDKRKTGKIPPLQASESQLKAFEAKQPPRPPEPPAEPPPSVSYPPLESPAR